MPDGVTQCKALITDDGRLVVVTQLEDGTMYALDRDETVALALAQLSAAARLYPSAKEFTDSVDFARAQIEDLHTPATVQ